MAMVTVFIVTVVSKAGGLAKEAVGQNSSMLPERFKNIQSVGIFLFTLLDSLIFIK